MELENRVKISGSPSRYQVGDVLYIGGEMRYSRSGKEAHDSTRMFLICCITGSTRCEIVDGPSAPVRKFETQETMHTVMSGLSLDSDSEKIPRWPQGMIWADFRLG